ncbi:hypothetical protein BH11CYA1_BH11CYA1_29530 [soil metagenome]
MSSPIICLGQQPCGFFPKRFLVAKIITALRLQEEIGGEIVFFYHDSDHDPRETRTILPHRTTHEAAQLNFSFENKTQRKFSPLYLKRVVAGWQEKTISQLPNYVDHALIDIFKNVDEKTISDFCLEMYRRMGLLEGLTVMRSSDKAFRRAACDISDFFVDAPYDNEIVRARFMDGTLKLHEGGDAYSEVPMVAYSKEQISPTRDSRLKWMQSVINCTHYVSGAGEQAYLNKDDAPDITFVTRDTIEQSDEAYTELH